MQLIELGLRPRRAPTPSSATDAGSGPSQASAAVTSPASGLMYVLSARTWDDAMVREPTGAGEQLRDVIEARAVLFRGEPTYAQAEAFLWGYEVGTGYTLLSGFDDWLLVRINDCSNSWWSSWRKSTRPIPMFGETVTANLRSGSRRCRHLPSVGGLTAHAREGGDCAVAPRENR